MAKSYSIAEARNNLAAIVHEVEVSHGIEITRRGRPVAILISRQEYERLKPKEEGFWSAYQSFRKRVNLSALNIDPLEIWSGIRDKTSGRKIEL